jgi:hypothetical protein
MELSEIASQVEEIVAREVGRICADKAALDEKSIRVLESLSKVLDHCITRRKGVTPPDPYAAFAIADLEKDFE